MLPSRSIPATVLIVALAGADPAAAGYRGGEILEHTAALEGVPPGVRVFRVYARFSAPTDQLLAVGGIEGVGPVSFATDCVGGLHNAGGPLAGLKAEDFPAAPVAPSWDTWITIGGDDGATQQTDYPQRFLDSDGVHAVVGGSAFFDDDAGWFDADPGSPTHPDREGRVLVAQLAVADGCCSLAFTACVKWQPAPGLPVYDLLEVEAFIDCPGSGACCLGAACVVDDSAGCAALGGTHLGPGTVCDGSFCAGACCLPGGSCMLADVNACAATGGIYLGDALACADVVCPAAPACPSDLDGDRVTGFDDLVLMLADWGACPPDCPADLDGDDVVAFGDLVLLLAQWGPCEAASTGACCLAGEACAALDAFACIAMEGLWLGTGLACTPLACARDCNGNGVPDSFDVDEGLSLDCNGDGVPDECQDCDGNGLSDWCDLVAGAADCDLDGLLDACEDDCDGDGLPDECAIAADPGLDCDGDGVPDDCAIAHDPGLDCDLDGVLDACAILAGMVADCNDDGLPDSCEPDCNGNGTPDDCDLAEAASLDVNGNGVPDECEADCDGNGVPDELDLESGEASDCNENGVRDDCDVATGASLDDDGDGIPDECQAFDDPAPRTFLEIADHAAARGHGMEIDFADAPIPAGFFGPGSDPWGGTIAFAGRAIDPDAHGSAALILRRAGDPFLPSDPPGGAPVAIAVEVESVAALNVDPIAVVTGATTRSWSVELAAAAGPAPAGTILAAKQHAGGGTLTMDLPLLPRLVFRATDDPLEHRILDFGAVGRAPIALVVRSMSWVHQGDPALLLEADDSAFVAGVVENPISGDQAVEESDALAPDAILRALPTRKAFLDLDIRYGIEGFRVKGWIPDGREAEAGGSICLANLNDTNGSGDGVAQGVDRDEAVVAATEVGRAEVDLMPIILRKVRPDLGGVVVLRRLGGDVRVWGSSTKGAEIVLPKEIPTADLPETFYVEARSPSGALRDIVLEMEYFGVLRDEVRATAVWAEHRRVWRERRELTMPGDLPADMSTGAGDLSGIVAERAKDGSYVGLGPFGGFGAPRDERIGGRILFELEVGPNGAEDLGNLVWDVTRQKRRRVRRVVAGTGVLSLVNDGPSADRLPDLDFAIEEQLDVELPQDDERDTDEDNEPDDGNGFLYSFDTPGLENRADARVNTQQVDFLVRWLLFREWARARLDNGSFRHRPGAARVEGSRGSPVREWYAVQYFRRAEDGRFEPDLARASASAPRVAGAGPQGPGFTVIHRPGAGAISEGLQVAWSSGGGGAWKITGSRLATPVFTGTGTAGPWSATLPGGRGRIDVLRARPGATPRGTYSYSVLVSEHKRFVLELGTVAIPDPP